jgi:hypothetical protein
LKKPDKRNHYQRKFQDGDMIWLANEYRRRVKSESSLTLEDFSVQYGVSADELRVYIPELNGMYGHSVILWHGTSKTRAESITKEGFRIKNKKKPHGIYFTKEHGVARDYAENRARNEKDEPAVIMCSIDLNQYSSYERRGSVFVFNTDSVGNEVVKQIAGLRKQHREKVEKKARDDSDMGVSLSFNSSPAGIAYWINSYLGLNAVNESHEAVIKIKQWLDEQSDADRFGEVPVNEIIEQLHKYGLIT